MEPDDTQVQGARDFVNASAMQPDFPTREDTAQRRIDLMFDLAIHHRQLRRELTGSDTSNGFENRFLYFQVERARVAMLPVLEDEKAKRLGKLVGSALGEGRKVARIELSKRSIPMWEMVYLMQESDPNPPLDVLVLRSTPYMLRSAALYTALDGIDRIEPEHLLAVCEIWTTQPRASVGSLTTDQIIDALESAKGEMTRTEISDLFHRHKTKTELDEAIDHLDHLDRLDVIVFGRRMTDGRPADVVRFSDSAISADGVPGTLSRGGFLRSAVQTLNSRNSHFANDGGDGQTSTNLSEGGESCPSVEELVE